MQALINSGMAILWMRTRRTGGGSLTVWGGLEVRVRAVGCIWRQRREMRGEEGRVLVEGWRWGVFREQKQWLWWQEGREIKKRKRWARSQWEGKSEGGESEIRLNVSKWMA